MGRLAELAQCLRFNLSDSLTGNVELPADLLERMLLADPDSEAHSQDAFLPGGQAREKVGNHIAKIAVNRKVQGLDGTFILDEVSPLAVILVANRLLQRERLLGNLENLPDLVEGEFAVPLPVPPAGVHGHAHAGSCASFGSAC